LSVVLETPLQVILEEKAASATTPQKKKNPPLLRGDLALRKRYFGKKMGPIRMKIDQLKGLFGKKKQNGGGWGGL